MSATSNTRVVWHPALKPWLGVVANNNSYVTDGSGRIENALEADVSALHSQGFVDSRPVANVDNTSNFGKG